MQQPLTGTFRADAIKKAARRSAWYSSEDDTIKTYNFFGRVRTVPNSARVRDVESGGDDSHLQKVSTENSAPSPIEAKRRQDYHDSNRGFEAPPKSSTYHGDNGRTDGQGFSRLGDDTITSSEGSKHSGEKEVHFNSDPSTENAQDGIISRSVGPQDGENKPRKRKMRKFMPWKKSEDEDPTKLEHSDTQNSKKKKKRKGANITFVSQFKAVFYSWINILLVAVPVGIALNFTNVNKGVVFGVNFIAIIPLAGMLAYATEELALYIGEVLGGLLNATFGNAVELIVGVIALAKGEILIVQTSLIGSMLSNLLLVMGMCFFFGGLRRVEQFFNVTVAQTGASLLALAVGSLIIPTAFSVYGAGDKGVAPVSRGTSVILLVIYGCYLLFQLRTHVDMYNEPSQKSPKKPSRKKSEGDAMRAMAEVGGSGAGASGGQVTQENIVRKEGDDDDDEGETPQLSRLGALITLAGSTVLVAICAEFMVDSIKAISGTISPEFIGLILLPIVGNAAEHATAVTVAIKDKMDLAIGVAVGSSLQIALLVLPLMVMLSWWGIGPRDAPMTLSFDGFQIIVLFVAVLVVNYLISDGKSHWLEGVLLQMMYLIIALAAWFYPTSADLA